MKKELKISAASKVVTMGSCPKISEGTCGIMWRQV